MLTAAHQVLLAIQDVDVKFLECFASIVIFNMFFDIHSGDCKLVVQKLSRECLQQPTGQILSLEVPP